MKYKSFAEMPKWQLFVNLNTGDVCLYLGLTPSGNPWVVYLWFTNFSGKASQRDWFFSDSNRYTVSKTPEGWIKFYRNYIIGSNIPFESYIMTVEPEQLPPTLKRDYEWIKQHIIDKLT